MIVLGNLKTGQTKQLDNGVTVTKDDGHYQVVTPRGTALLRFLKDEREWRFVIDGDSREHTLSAGTTGKTAVETLIKEWPVAPEPTDSPAVETETTRVDEPKDERESALEKIRKLLAAGNDPTLDAKAAEAYLAKAASLMTRHSIEAEELRRAEGGEAGQGDDEITTWSFVVNMKGGHGPHRAAGYMSVIRAFGAGTYFTHYRPKGVGYMQQTLRVYVIAQADVITRIRDFLAIMELAMERQAAEISRRVSSATRAAGGHHSKGGCDARRGFMRGFGQGIADRLSSSTQELSQESDSKALVLADRSAQVKAYMDRYHSDLKPARAIQYDRTAYAEGRQRGQAFASPAVTEPSASRRRLTA